MMELVGTMLRLNQKLVEFGGKQTDGRTQLEKEIAETDAKIDQLVYVIYGLTEEEKKIIEDSLT